MAKTFPNRHKLPPELLELFAALYRDLGKINLSLVSLHRLLLCNDNPNWITELLHMPPHQHTHRKEIMSALENAVAALARLTKSVDVSVTVMGTPHPTDAQVQTIADGMESQSDRLDLANGTTTPPPPPPPTP